MNRLATSLSRFFRSLPHPARTVHLVVAILGGLTITAGAAAETFPSRPVTIVMPWGDGFPANVTRLYAKKLSDGFGQPVIVDTRPGAGGEIAARHVTGAPGDGYTLLATGTSVVIRPVLDGKSVDPTADLQPIAQLATTPYVIVARAGRFGNFLAFLKSARATPGRLNYASAGVGTGMHLLGELIDTNAGIDIIHVPYASGARQLQALRSGDVDVAIISLVTALPQITSGALEALAVSSAHRSAALPATPTLKEGGVPGIPAMGAWISLFGPRNLPPAVSQRLSAQIRASAQDKELRANLAAWGAEVDDVSAAYLTNVLRVEGSVWKRVAQGKGISVQ